MKKVLLAIAATLTLMNSARAVNLNVYESGFVIGAQVEARLHVNNVLVDETPEEDRVVYAPEEEDYPIEGALGSSGSYFLPNSSLVTDPSYSDQLIYVSSNITANWTSLIDSQQTNPKIELTSNLRVAGAATRTGRTGYGSASTSGIIYRAFNRASGSAWTGATMVLNATAAGTNPSTHTVTLKAEWGDNYISAFYSRSQNKWSVAKRLRSSAGTWQGSNVEYSIVNGASLSVTETGYANLTTSSFTPAICTINKLTDPRAVNWILQDHALIGSVVASGSGGQQEMDYNDDVKVSVTPLATVTAE